MRPSPASAQNLAHFVRLASFKLYHFQRVASIALHDAEDNNRGFQTAVAIACVSKPAGFFNLTKPNDFLLSHTEVIGDALLNLG
jgi:hypothetical protein